MALEVRCVKVGPIQTNCYIVCDPESGESLMIDPGDDSARLLAALKGSFPKLIVLTHNHWDHVGALPELAKATGAEVCAHAADASGLYGGHEGARWNDSSCRFAHRAARLAGMEAGRALADGDTLELGPYSFEVIHTPGHTPGCICLYCADEGLLFTGDTVFAQGRFGRTDFEGGSMAQMRESLSTKFGHIPDDVRVLPGHEGPSTMRLERSLNPYLR